MELHPFAADQFTNHGFQSPFGIYVKGMKEVETCCIGPPLKSGSFDSQRGTDLERPRHRERGCHLFPRRADAILGKRGEGEL